jgi:hypothetical protein
LRTLISSTPHTTHVAEIGLGIGGVHLAEKHPPQARVRFADQGGHFAHGHFAHEQQREGFKLFGEVRAQSFPRWPHPKEMTALAAFAAWQTTGDFAAMLENIQMPPRQPLGVVVTKNQAAIFGTAHQFPQFGSLADLQKYRPALRLKPALHHFPVQPQTQPFVK